MRHIFPILVLAACGSSGGSDDDGAPADAATDAATSPDAAAGCPRTAAPADRDRHVVVSRPYEAGTAAHADTWEVLDYSAAGVLTRPSPRRMFTMGRATMGAIVFTPDGEIGLVAQDDGTIGVFRLDAGVPTTVDAGFDGGGAFYASRIVMDPRGDRAWVLDGNWRNNGGGIYGVTIGCTGALTSTGLVTPAKLTGGLVITGDRAIVAAADVVDVTVGNDVHLIAWGAAPARLASADAFGAKDPIIGGSALTADGASFLVGDTSGFSTAPNRVAVVGVGPTALSPIAALPVEDPQAIVTSPFGDVAIVASAFGDALFVLDTGGPAGAWRVRGEVTYQGAGPLIPGDLAAVTRGSLSGRVLVSENVSIRQLAFRAGGAVDDLDSLQFGSGLDQIPGALGVTP